MSNIMMRQFLQGDDSGFSYLWVFLLLALRARQRLVSICSSFDKDGRIDLGCFIFSSNSFNKRWKYISCHSLISWIVKTTNQVIILPLGKTKMLHVLEFDIFISMTTVSKHFQTSVSRVFQYLLLKGKKKTNLIRFSCYVPQLFV